MAWLRAAMSIPGESYEPKLLALIAVGARTPSGDIVEIGCLFGRTAALLAMLANGYDLGPVICVDPWSIRSTEQGNAQLKAASEGFDWDAFRRIFEVNVTPFAGGRLNYIHALSTDGYKTYAAGTEIETEAFGRTRYSRRIGLLHIDGNHEYEHVLADANDWIPHVKPGGWIVFDDYEWDWGDGPQRVADAWIADNTPRVRTHFVAGGAMFIQLA
jgi:SAM-dependent methyltransferase